MKTVIDMLMHHSVESPDKTALIVEDRPLTYQQLSERVVAVAEYFSDLGTVKGSRIVLSADASAAFVYGYFACHLLSAICVPIEPKCSDVRLEYIVDKVHPLAVFCSQKRKLRGLHSALISDLNDCGEKSFLLTSHNIPNMDCIADIIFTSGTTGDAKGVVLTHRAISTAAAHINYFIGNRSIDLEVMPLPLSHSFGLGRLRCNIVKGATIILVPGFSSLSEVYRALDVHKATGLASVPAGFAILLSVGSDQLAKYSTQLEYIEIGSSPMPLEHKHRLMELLPNTRICMHYGLTEASRSVFIEFHADKHHLLSIGRPSPGVEVEIVDDAGLKCLPGQSGRIKIKGDHCTIGYWENEELSAEILNSGWLLTGDVGYSDSDGYYHLQSRESDIINVGGQKVSPSEVETLLLSHPSIAECACVGIPDPRGISGMAVKAYLKLSVDAPEPLSVVQLAKILRGKIEAYKMPVAYQWVDKIPKTESGKIKRSLLVNSND